MLYLIISLFSYDFAYNVHFSPHQQRVEKEHRRSRRHERKKRKSRDAKNPDSEPHAFDSSVVMDGNLNNENQPLITNDGDNVKPNTASDDTTHTEQTGTQILIS